jgi:hypothetical protein
MFQSSTIIRKFVKGYAIFHITREGQENFIHICTTLEQVEEWLDTLGRDRRYVQYIYY